MTSKGKGRRPNNALYGNALPVIPAPYFSSLSSPSTSSTPSKSTSTSTSRSISSILLSPLSRLTTVLNPRCTGVFDPSSRSVWILSDNRTDIEILWRRGFFGKGNLSRSEPSWRERRIGAIQEARKGSLTAEEVTALRRAERAHFKAERERAIAEAAAEAEERFRTQGILPEPPKEHISTTVRANIAREKQEGKRVEVEDGSREREGNDGGGASPETATIEEEKEIVVEDVEHLQLSLQEAYFLAWGLDCLTILDPKTNTPLSLPEIWTVFLQCSSSIPTPFLSSLPPSVFESLWRRPDNPFLVHYAAYHHFRSLGWVVKNGIKFCVDLLLYKKGPVFSHAEFSIVIIPTYEDPADEASSPFHLANTNSKPFSWAWLSTLNRANTQVRKSLMIAYVTIPAISRLSQRALDSPEVLGEYTVREITVKRFVPARMRD